MLEAFLILSDRLLQRRVVFPTVCVSSIKWLIIPNSILGKDCYYFMIFFLQVTTVDFFYLSKAEYLPAELWRFYLIKLRIHQWFSNVKSHRQQNSFKEWNHIQSTFIDINIHADMSCSSNPLLQSTFPGITKQDVRIKNGANNIIMGWEMSYEIRNDFAKGLDWF